MIVFMVIAMIVVMVVVVIVVAVVHAKRQGRDHNHGHVRDPGFAIAGVHCVTGN